MVTIDLYKIAHFDIENYLKLQFTIYIVIVWYDMVRYGKIQNTITNGLVSFKLIFKHCEN